MLQFRYRRRRHFGPQKLDLIVRTYPRPSCIREDLVPAKRKHWYEIVLMLVLLRPWRCPHCFGRFIRGIT